MISDEFAILIYLVRSVPDLHLPGELQTPFDRCRAHGLQNARISCREINIRSRAYPLTWATSGVRGTLFLSFVAVPIKAYLGDVFCGCLDPAVPMGTHVMSSSISGLS